MITFATRFKEITDAHLTFHIGDSRVWWQRKYRNERRHNDHAAAQALFRLAQKRELKIPWLIQCLLMIPLLKNRLIVDAWMRHTHVEDVRLQC